MRQKGETETKQRLLDAFKAQFVISDDDVQALTSAEAPIDDHFFDVLAKVKQVHRDCEVLLGGEHQRIGLELMERSSRNLNSAYQKLYKWIQKEFRSLNLEDPRISGPIRRALRVLAERPSLFHNCLDFFAEARDYVLSEAFHYALTQAVSDVGSERAIKPIEFSAHDPLRYIGDMLAWVHSTTVSEREALESLFVGEGEEIAKGIEAGLSSEPWSRADRDDGEETVPFDGQKALSDLVNRDLAGIARALRQRVELVIQGHDDPVVCYKVVNVLSFYQATFSRLLGPESSLADLMQILEKSTFNRLVALFHDQHSSLLGDRAATSPPKDLSAPEFLLDALDVLTSLMKECTALFDTEDAETSPEGENKFTPVLRAALDPFLDLAKSSSEQLQDPTARTIYLTNIILAARSTISPFPFASATHLNPLSSSLSNLRVDLLKIQYDYLLRTSGLQVLLSALDAFSKTSNQLQPTPTKQNGETGSPEQQQQPKRNPPPNLADIATLPPFHPDNLSLISQQLDDFLPSALVDASDHLKRLQSVTLVKDVMEEAVEAFCRDFEFVEGMVIGADVARGVIDVGGRSDVESLGLSVLSGSGRGERREEEEEKEKERKDGDWSLRALFPRTTGEIRVLLS